MAVTITNIMVRIIYYQAFLLPIAVVYSHSRWSCPEPRSSSTSIKTGPCGSESLATFSEADVIEVAPGPHRVVFEESIHHTGSPFRISLSSDGNDENPCVLLDHIPHNDCCKPSYWDEDTYTQYTITINIPNIQCERCSLHLSNPMTDKIGSDGAPDGKGCTDPGSCFSVYHSCTRPLRIKGDANAVKRNEYTCPDWRSLNEDWPTLWVGDNGEDVDASISGVYRRESSDWNEKDFTLMTVPAQYRQNVGGLCGKQEEEVAVLVTEQMSATTTTAITTTTTTTTDTASSTQETTSSSATEATASVPKPTTTSVESEAGTKQPTSLASVGIPLSCSFMSVTIFILLSALV